MDVAELELMLAQSPVTQGERDANSALEAVWQTLMAPRVPAPYWR